MATTSEQSTPPSPLDEQAAQLGAESSAKIRNRRRAPGAHMGTNIAPVISPTAAATKQPAYARERYLGPLSAGARAPPRDGQEAELRQPDLPDPDPGAS